MIIILVSMWQRHNRQIFAQERLHFLCFEKNWESQQRQPSNSRVQMDVKKLHLLLTATRNSSMNSSYFWPRTRLCLRPMYVSSFCRSVCCDDRKRKFQEDTQEKKSHERISIALMKPCLRVQVRHAQFQSASLHLEENFLGYQISNHVKEWDFSIEACSKFALPPSVCRIRPHCWFFLTLAPLLARWVPTSLSVPTSSRMGRHCCGGIPPIAVYSASFPLGIPIPNAPRSPRPRILSPSVTTMACKCARNCSPTVHTSMFSTTRALISLACWTRCNVGKSLRDEDRIWCALES